MTLVSKVFSSWVLGGRGLRVYACVVHRYVQTAVFAFNPLDGRGDG